MVDNTKHGRDRAMSGEINWFELPVDDTARAREFYGQLFGWRTSEFGDDYHVIENGPAGAIAPKDAELTHPRVYFATDDIDASVKRARTRWQDRGHCADAGGRQDHALPRRPSPPVQSV